jgi:hypothetical protein
VALKIQPDPGVCRASESIPKPVGSRLLKTEEYRNDHNRQMLVIRMVLKKTG